MTRKLTFLILALFALISGPGWGQNTYTKATSLQVGDEVVLVCENANMEMSGISTTSTKYGIGTEFVDSPSGTYTMTVVAGSETGSFSFKNGSNYLRWNSGNSLDAAATSVVKNSSWTISFDGNGNATILNCNDTNRQIWWNNGSPRFACYTGKTADNTYYTIQLYKKQGTPSATLESIEVTTAPTKVIYTEGEYFDPTGLVITKHFVEEGADDEDLAYSETTASQFSFNPTLTDALAATDTQVEITVGGKSANQAITVNPAPKYTITFMDRTSQVGQREINQGAAVGELPADPDDIGTYKFQGWAEQFEGTVQDAPDFVTSTTVPTSDMTYYAVYAEVSGDLQDKSIVYDHDGQHVDWILTDGVDKTTYVILNNGASIASPSIEFTSITSIVINARTFGGASYKKVNAYFNNSLIGSIEAASSSLADYSINEISTTNGNGSFTFSSTTTSSTNGPGVAQITINYKEGELNISNYTQNPVAKTLVSIEVSGTPAEFWKGDAFNHDGMTVMANWDDESQTDVTADCEFSTPDMATAGEKTVTVTYQGQTDTYTINVQTIANTLETAYSIADAIEIIDAEKDLATEVYVAGKICQIDSYNSQYKSITYWISTDGTEENMFEVYSGKGLNGADFTSANDIVLQADVIVYGLIKKYGEDTYEFDKNNYLASYTAPEVEEYAINLNPNAYGTISADLATASAGQTVTLSATPIEHFHLTSWTVLDDDANEIPVSDNQFIMPASDVEVEATFAEDELYAFTYYYNGEYHTDYLAYGGTLITLEEDPDMSPAGFSFVGWSTSVASTNVIEGTTYTLNENVDFYAVFEKASTSRENDEVSFVKVTEAPEDWSGEYLLVYEGGYNESADFTYEPLAWNGADAYLGYQDVTINDDGNIYENPDNVVTLILAPMDDNYSIKIKGGDNNGSFIGRSANKNGIDFSDEPQSNTIEISNNSAIITSDGGRTMQFNYTVGENGQRFRYYSAGGQQPVQLYKKQGAEPTANRRYTRVYDDAYPATGSLLSVEGPSIIVSGYTLTVTGTMTNTNAANLVIEDGAQLYYTNGENVNATFQKSINGYTGTNDHYYLIANPTDNTTVANLTNENGYDLYTFNPAGDEQGREWINEKANPLVESEKGYLYANSGATTTLEFAGKLIPAASKAISLTYAGDDNDFPGFNLIGNPYACNATISGDYTFLKIDDDAIIPSTGSVAPCEGIFVEATAAEQSVTFTPALPASQADAPSAMSIEVSQNRGNVIDRAIVRFDGANNLHKFMMNPAHTNLSIAKGGETFAAISTEAEGELPVNFKAEKNGTYTISVNTENVDAEYLHLIDNMTGMDTDLLSTPSYTFDAKTSDYASRFKLVFGVKNDNEEMSQASSFAYINNGEIVISNEGRATLQVIDVLGRIVSSEEINGECRISTNGLTAGVYVLNLNGMTQKIVVR